GVDHALNIERTRSLEHIHGPHDVDLNAQCGVRGRHRPHEACSMDDVRDPMPFDDVEQARHVEHVAELDTDLVADIANEPRRAVAGEDDGTVALLDAPAARVR